MRIAIVSDVHGNRTAFEAVLADLKQTAPDLILHGGDLADSGSDPAGVLDHIRDLDWPGVLGNTDEMLFRPESLETFAAARPQFGTMFAMVGEMAESARETLGETRLRWLETLPRVHLAPGIAVVHARPETCWASPAIQAADAELRDAYASSGTPVVVYGHIHCPYIRVLPGITIANSGSVGLPYDGDHRASYLLVDDGAPEIRRVEYDIDAEIRELFSQNAPHAEWIAGMLRTGRFQML